VVEMIESGITREIKPDVNLGILIGLLLTDGWVSSKQIGISNKSEEIHRIFKEKVSLLFGTQNFKERKSGFNVKQTEVNNI
jgi:hypothetical protein